MTTALIFCRWLRAFIFAQLYQWCYRCRTLWHNIRSRPGGPRGPNLR